MINRDSRGHSYFIVRGEILGFMKDEQLRKHLPRMFSLIKNEIGGAICLVNSVNERDLSLLNSYVEVTLHGQLLRGTMAA
ncbi:hypothetical protein VNO80_31498 [Phaseolus coccineus]|uniref:Uncharacterized protein n=1 Tax=Phaseolus coccineus TaxID=3886 RepID=A0AAN9L165_PHACN